MSMKILAVFQRYSFIALTILIILNITGCSSFPGQQNANSEEDSQTTVQDSEDDDQEIINIYCGIYKREVERNKPVGRNVIQDIVEQLGKRGYTAVDSRNQIDMTEADKAVKFCEDADARKTSELTVIEVTWSGGFARYDLKSEDGNTQVNRKYYEYGDESMKKTSDDSYTAGNLQYTKEGYLMFSGVLTSDDVYIVMGEMDEMEDHAAFRVAPLDERCRELNERYLLPIGYEHNNMFLTDWSEEDFGDLDFYDMYDILYQEVTGRQIPYTEADDAGEGKVYQIPEDEFEKVIRAHFKIDSKTLQSKTVYDSENGTYEYRPRGFWEKESPEHPDPEVVSYTENEDGTITLFVNAVFSLKDNSKFFSHEVTVRPLEDGGVQYVSNHRIPSEYSNEETWYVPRLYGKDWDEVYGQN